MVSFAKRKELGADLRGIFAASDREQALGIALTVADNWWGKGHEKVGSHLEEHIEECLTCLAYLMPGEEAVSHSPVRIRRGRGVCLAL